MSPSYILFTNTISGAFYVELYEFASAKEQEAVSALVSESHEAASCARGRTLADAAHDAIERMTTKAIR